MTIADRSSEQNEQTDVGKILDAAPFGKIQWLVLALCALVAVLDGFDVQVISFVATPISKEWDIPLSSFGPVFGAGLLGLAIGSLLLGFVADSVGRRPILIAATAIFGSLTIAAIYATDVQTLAILRFLAGIGLGGAVPNFIALAAEYAPKRFRNVAIAAALAGFPLGGLIGSIIAAELIAVFGWRSVFIVAGMLPLGFAAILIPLLPESIRFLVLQRRTKNENIAQLLNTVVQCNRYSTSDKFTLSEPKALTSSRVIDIFRGGYTTGTLLIWLTFFCSLLTVYFVVSWLPPLLQYAGLSQANALQLTALFNGGGILGGLGVSYLTDRRRPHKVLAFGFALGALSLIALSLTGDNTTLLYSVCFLAGLAILGAQIGLYGLAAAFYITALRGTGVGWAIAIGRFGSIVGPVVAGVLLSLDLEASQIFRLAALPLIVSACSVALLARTQRKLDVSSMSLPSAAESVHLSR